MKLWSGVLSPFSAKVRIALAEKGVEVEILEIPWSRERLWGPKPDAFLRVSPRGEVPTLVDGNLAVFDSTIICEYLEEAYPAPALMPTTPRQRAACRMWEERADNLLATRLTVMIRELFLKPDGSGRDAAAVADAQAAFQAYYAALEQGLESEDYLCGLYSLADISTWVCLAFARTLGAGFESQPNLRAWFDRVHARRVVHTEMEKILAAAAVA